MKLLFNHQVNVCMLKVCFTSAGADPQQILAGQQRCDSQTGGLVLSDDRICT